jgi:hypothetical protein
LHRLPLAEAAVNRGRALEALVRSHERERQAWVAERAQLLDRIMHLSARPSQPWAESPAQRADRRDIVPDDADRVGAVADVDQVLLEELP